MDVKKIEELLRRTFHGDEKIKKIEALRYTEGGITKSKIIMDFHNKPEQGYEYDVMNALGPVGVIHHFNYGSGYRLNVNLEEKEAFQMKEGMEIIPNEWYNPIIGYYVYEFFVNNRKFHLHVNTESNAFLMKEEKNEYPLLDLLLFREAIESHKLIMLLEGIENPLETLKLDIHIQVGKRAEYWIQNGKVEKIDRNILKDFSKPGFLSF